MNPEETSKLVTAWIELQKTGSDTVRHDELFWSFSQLWDLTHDEPETAFDVILTILRIDSSSIIEENLSAGPLEDLLAHHGPAFIERIEREASRNQRFRHLLGGVWQNSITDEVWSRVQACWDRHGWDGITDETVI